MAEERRQETPAPDAPASATTIAAEGLSRRLFWTGLLLLVGLVLLLPVFPSGDGPVHIYYSQILSRLAGHQPGVYGQVYFIRHLVQPYSLHYWWLIGVERFVSAAAAEKSFVAAILFTNALGFRFLARTLGRQAPAAPLLILPLLLSWALGSGFLNFCFAAGVLFFAYGFYLRYAGSGSTRMLAGYLAALCLLVLSHPVPLLLLQMLFLCEIAVLLPCARKQQPNGVDWKALRPVSLCFPLAGIAFSFPMAIADKASVADSLLRDLRPHMAQVRAIGLGYRLSMFAGSEPATAAFTAFLVALAPTAVVLLVRSGGLRRLAEGRAAAADRLCLAALMILLGTIVFPSSMNGSALFADRMIPLLWPLLIVCAAAVPATATGTRWTLWCAAAATAASLVFAGMYLEPAAREQAALTAADLPRGAKGLFVTAPPVERPLGPKLSGEVLQWGGARAFAAHEDVLLNSPWMQLTIVPVGERAGAGLLRDHLAGQLSESPADLGRLLQTRNQEAQAALAGAAFLLYSDPASTRDEVARALPRYLPADARQWRCSARDFYAVCVRHARP